MSHQHKQSAIYGNWNMLSPSGELLSRCDEKRASWYLARDLAEKLDNCTIKLKFAPNKGDKIASAVPYMLAEKENRCVVCGTSHELTRHHVVPYQYRREFPAQYKNKASYDVLPLCITHHEAYETQAQIYSHELESRYHIRTEKLIMTAEQRRLMKLQSAALALYTQTKIPQVRREELEAILQTEFGTIDAKTVLDAISVPKLALSRESTHAFRIVRTVLDAGGLQSFIEGWRQHFVTTMNPQYLSPLWQITQPI